jgi:GT2 family glycosyltransferase
MAAGSSGTAPVVVNGLHGSAFAVRRRTFTRIGGMSDRHFMYHEDVELSLRLAMRGYKILAIPESVVYHKYALYMSPEKFEWLERNRWLTVAELYGGATLARYWPWFLLTEAMVLGYAGLRGRDFVRAKCCAARWVWARRREVKAIREARASLRLGSERHVMSTLQRSYNWRQFMILANEPGGWLHEGVLGLLARGTLDGASSVKRGVEAT